MEQTARISDLYMPMLERLSDDDKLDIISKLITSMRQKTHKENNIPDLRTCFSGDWENGKSTIEIDDELRADRVSEPKDLIW